EKRQTWKLFVKLHYLDSFVFSFLVGCRRIIQYTPIPAIANTAISNNVSKARDSTSMTFTIFPPPASSNTVFLYNSAIESTSFSYYAGKATSVIAIPTQIETIKLA